MGGTGTLDFVHFCTPIAEKGDLSFHALRPIAFALFVPILVQYTLEFKGTSIVSDGAPRKIISVVFYKQESGKEPVKEWLKSLKKLERKTIGEDIKMVQEGWPLGMPLVGNLGKGLWEVRSILTNTIARVLFVMHEGQIVLLHGFFKKTQKTPSQDLEIGLKRAKEIWRG